MSQVSALQMRSAIARTRPLESAPQLPRASKGGRPVAAFISRGRSRGGCCWRIAGATHPLLLQEDGAEGGAEPRGP